MKWTTVFEGETKSGDCPATISTDWFLILATDESGVITGTAMFSYNAQPDRIAEISLYMACSGLLGNDRSYSRDFKVVGKTEAPGASVVLKPHNCTMGDCPQLLDLNARLVQKDGKLILTFDKQDPISLNPKTLQ